jgi:hypothetical protein
VGSNVVVQVEGLPPLDSDEAKQAFRTALRDGIKRMTEAAREDAPVLIPGREYPANMQYPQPVPNVLKDSIKSGTVSYKNTPQADRPLGSPQWFAAIQVGAEYAEYVVFGTGKGHVRYEGLRRIADPREPWEIPSVDAEDPDSIAGHGYLVISNPGNKIPFKPARFAGLHPRNTPNFQPYTLYKPFSVHLKKTDQKVEGDWVYVEDILPKPVIMPGQEADSFLHDAIRRNRLAMHRDIQRRLAEVWAKSYRDVKFKMRITLT